MSNFVFVVVGVFVVGVFAVGVFAVGVLMSDWVPFSNGICNRSKIQFDE